MKKPLGILILIIGIIMTGMGISSLSAIETSENTIEGKVRDRVSQKYRDNKEKDGVESLGLIGGGVLICIFGIVLMASKSEQNFNIGFTSSVNFSGNDVVNNEAMYSSGLTDDKIKKLEQLGGLRDKGLISAKEFEKEKLKLLR
jgi:hypothetical protein